MPACNQAPSSTVCLALGGIPFYTPLGGSRQRARAASDLGSGAQWVQPGGASSLLLVAMPGAPSSFLFLVVRMLLVVMPLFLVAMPLLLVASSGTHGTLWFLGFARYFACRWLEKVGTELWPKFRL